MARRRKGVPMNTSAIPLAEFSREEGLISPDFEHLPLTLPRRCLMAFLGEKRIAAFAEKRGGKVLGTFLSLTKPFPLYEIPGEKEPLLLVQAPAGAPAAVLIEDRLFAYGAEKVLAIGCCGSLANIPENCFFPIEKALRDEGTSYHYLPPSRFIELDKEPLLHLKTISGRKTFPSPLPSPGPATASSGKRKKNPAPPPGRLQPGGHGSQRPGRLRQIQRKGICGNHVHRRHPLLPHPRPAPLGKRKPERCPPAGHGSAGGNLGAAKRPGFKEFRRFRGFKGLWWRPSGAIIMAALRPKTFTTGLRPSGRL